MRRPRNKNDIAAAIPPAPPYTICPAKTWVDAEGRTLAGRAIYEHCKIVARVAEELLRRYPSQIVEKLFPKNIIAIAGVHDVGKISPTFLRKIFSNLYNPPAETYATFAGLKESRWGGHAGTSQLALQKITTAPYVAEIAGQHHGFVPPIAGSDIAAEKFGGDDWQKEREKFVHNILDELNCNWPDICNYPTALLAAGLTTVADWIGSGEIFEDPAIPWKANISRAVDNAGFITPEYQKGLLFEEIFPFSPWPAQQALIDKVTSPGVYIFEASMGLGKTEAALYAAYRMVEKQNASGIYFALPTQLTSNKIYTRFNHFLQKILHPESPHSQALLLHGSAWMEEMNMGEEARPGYSWFNANKRGLLAPFAVGTIDQALMAAMNVKHGFVRTFGLAGKVVILDEVHSYDIYTGTILNELVKLLRQLHCTVIILSATLSRNRRSDLLSTTVYATEYPLVSALPNDNEKATETAVATGDSQKITISHTSSSAKALEEVLSRAEQGQHILWIENTIAEAQQSYANIAARAAEIGIECGLLHSRFTPHDRQKNETCWVNLFGKEGWKKRGEGGRILIGSQVLEQSLDIDADFLVSRFCPSDMLLQRLGRLWRHSGTPRPKTARPEAWLLVPQENNETDPSRLFGASGFVYSPYVLHRSLEVWLEKSAVLLPADIRSLIEETYVERKEQGFMVNLQKDLHEGDKYHKGTRALQQFACLALAENGKTLPESAAQTRFSEQDTTEVLLYSHLKRDPQKEQSTFTLIDETTVSLSWRRHNMSWRQWRKAARHLLSHTLKVRPQYAPNPVSRDNLLKTGLGNCLYLGAPDQATAQLRLARVSETGTLSGFDGAELHDKYILNYRNDIGYTYKKRQEGN